MFTLNVASAQRVGPLGKTILVPLTNSLYVPGKLSDPENVIVDVGTGYYVKKVCIVILILQHRRVNVRFSTEPITSTEALRDKGGLHPHQLGNFAGYDTEKAG